MTFQIINHNDTIVALSTAQGIAAIALVRLSGKESFAIMQKLFPSKTLNDLPSHSLHFGKLIFQNQEIDEVVLGLFKCPNSYTGEDIVEISCHGSPIIINKIIQACLFFGARMAKAGEFTQRAFFNGRLDLLQAEAVADLIHSENEATHKNALNNLRSGFSLKLKEIRKQLIEFAALIELELDFSEEDLEFADRTKFNLLLQKLQSELLALSNSFRWGNALKNGIQIALIGKPNAGKSTLLNAILNEERAIVSEIAGTTRDTIEECLHYKGLTFRFIDTAGIRKSNDEIEQMGVSKSYEKMKQADYILYLFDVEEMSLCELIEQEDYFKNISKPYLLLANKADKIEAQKLNQKFKSIPTFLPIIAKDKKGIDEILDHIDQHFRNKNTNQEEIFITNLRHFEALEKIQHNLSIIQEGLNQNLSGDLLSVEIKHCLHHIGELTGEVTNENILDDIFSKFCIGK